MREKHAEAERKKGTAGSESMSGDLCEMTCMAKRGRERVEEGKGREAKKINKKACGDCYVNEVTFT